MLDDAISSRIRQLIQARHQGFTDSLNAKCIQVKHENSRTGSIVSGATLMGLHKVCVGDLNDFGRFIWETTKRVLTTFQVNWSANLAADLKNDLRQHLNQAAGEANRVFHAQLPVDPSGHIQRAAASFPINEHYLLAIYGAEADLYADGLKASEAKESGKGNATGSTYHVGQGTMFIMHGEYATANITINADTAMQMEGALNNIADAIRSSKLESKDKDEALALTGECLAEVQVEKPNSIKLRSLMRGIADVTSFLADGTTLLTALYGAAQKIGISM